MENEKPSLSTFATVQEYKAAAAAFDAADRKRRTEDAERLPAEKLEWEAPAGAEPVGHVVTWNKGGSGERKSIEPIGKSGYSLAESLPEGTMIWTTPPAAPAVDAEELGKLVALAEAAVDNAWVRCMEFEPLANPAAILRIAALVAQQAARIEELSKDADRYRYLRDFSGSGGCLRLMRDDINFDANAYIDAALQEGK